MRKILESCPTCGGPLTITEVRCERCATEVRSQYQPCPFCRLSPEQMNFILLFVQGRGNLSEMEKALGVSYPTIRGKLEEIIRLVSEAPVAASQTTGQQTGGSAGLVDPAITEEPVATDRRREILSRIASGELSAAEGLAALKAESR